MRDSTFASSFLKRLQQGLDVSCCLAKDHILQLSVVWIEVSGAGGLARTQQRAFGDRWTQDGIVALSVSLACVVLESALICLFSQSHHL